MRFLSQGMIGLAILAGALAECGAGAAEPQPWITLFDGTSLAGWHVSAKTGHSGPSKNTSGGRWVLEDGAIVGSQDQPGNGGIILTDREFGDFEVVVEMKIDFGPVAGPTSVTTASKMPSPSSNRSRMAIPACHFRFCPRPGPRSGGMASGTNCGPGSSVGKRPRSRPGSMA